MHRLLLIVVALLATGVAPAAADSETRELRFEDCLDVIRKTATENGTTPLPVVSNNDMRMVRIPTADGSLLVTCNRPNQRLTITKSDRKCGVDLKC